MLFYNNFFVHWYQVVINGILEPIFAENLNTESMTWFCILRVISGTEGAFVKPVSKMVKERDSFTNVNQA